MGPPDVAGGRPQGAAPQKATDPAKDHLGYRHDTPDDRRDAAGAAGTAFDRIYDALDRYGKRPRRSGDRITALCPAHDDHEASLTVYSKPGRIRVKCWSQQCPDTEIMAVIDLRAPADLFDEPRAGVHSRSRIIPRPRPAPQLREPIQAALDRLLELPDLGERLCRGIAWQDMIAAAQAAADYWRRRADRFDSEARHETARACRNKAIVLLWEVGGDLDG